METQMETVSEMETSYLPHASLDRNQVRCGTGSTGIAAWINSNEVQYDEQIHDDKTSGKRVGSVRGNCVQVGAWRHHPGQALRETDHQDTLRRSRAPGGSEASDSSELDRKRSGMYEGRWQVLPTRQQRKGNDSIEDYLYRSI